MKSRNIARLAGLGIAAVLVIAAFGCSKKAGIHDLIPNKPPTVDITSAPIDNHDPASYSLHLSWSGDDPDGRVAYFEYAIDPGDSTPVWHQTTKNDTTFTFPSRAIIDTSSTGVIQGASPHIFEIRAVDNLGARSEIKTRSFTSTTVCPTVLITSPRPNGQLTAKLTPSMTVTWVGDDPDGFLVGKNKPIKYKFHRFENPNPDISWDIVKNHPTQLRDYYAARNFAGWDSVGGDTTSIQISGQAVGHEFMFVIVAIDTAGAYSPVFNLGTNMLWYEVGYAATLGPVIEAFNQSFDFTMPSGGYTPTDPVSWFNLELPADNQVTINWIATPPLGAAIQSYRWRLDGDVGDETPRTGPDDWYHWSDGAASTTSATIGPFNPGISTFLYIEATDNNGLRSLMTIVLHPVRPAFDKDLLIVDDTRLDTDQFVAGKLQAYAGTWPSAAELDTFLYARGGVPWRQAQVTTPPPFTRPGVFAGYSYDTLGTRQGIIIQANGVALSLIGHYKHLIWMTEGNSATYGGDALDKVRPGGTLRWMCQAGHMNTLGSYISAGGLVWLLGGDGAYASLVNYNNKNNDNEYASGGVSITVFSNDKGELVPGRMMYDAAHWQNEIAVHPVSITAQSIVKSLHTPKQPWTSPGWNYTHVPPITSPDYTLLPAKMNRKALTLGDSLPPTRTVSSQFYSSGTFDVEYMPQPNYVIEDMDPDPFSTVERSALDTLMDIRGSGIAPLFTIGAQQPSMTYYHGTTSPEFVFSGFDIWKWSRADDIKLVDFVLQQIWHMPHDNTARYAPQAAARPGFQSTARARAAAVPSGAVFRLPVPRTASR